MQQDPGRGQKGAKMVLDMGSKWGIWLMQVAQKWLEWTQITFPICESEYF